VDGQTPADTTHLLLTTAEDKLMSKAVSTPSQLNSTQLNAEFT